jgi:glycerophosphoryl diester phosphodiesterase
MKVIGHRGWPTRYPDNVLAGIEAALTVADMVEVDIRASADGTLVLSHDPVMNGRVVAETTWETLSQLDLGGFPPASLDQLLQRFPGSPFNLEVKNDPDEAGFDPDHEVALRTASAARPGDLLTCFDWATMDSVRRFAPAVATGLLVDAGWNLAGAVDHALAKGHIAVVAHWELALRSGPIVMAAAEAGITISVWTLNDPGRVGELASIGVTAIITDDPGELRRAVG